MSQSAKHGAKPPQSPRALDVIAPGKTAPTPSARPIIVTNRPMIQDPMAPPADREVEAPEVEPSRIARPVKAAPVIAPGKQPAADEAAPGLPAADGGTAPVAPSAAQPAATAPPETAPAAEPAGPGPAAKPAPGTLSTDAPAAAAAPAAATQQKAAREQAARLAAQEQIVVSRQYYLPISVAEQRRNVRRAVAVLVVVLVAACVWLDLLLDADIVRLGPLRPLTHFFGTVLRAGLPR